MSEQLFDHRLADPAAGAGDQDAAAPHYEIDRSIACEAPVSGSSTMRRRCSASWRQTAGACPSCTDPGAGNLTQLEPDVPARGDKLPFVLTDHHSNMSADDLAGDLAPSVQPVQVLVAIARVLIQRCCADSFEGIEHEG